MDIHAVVPVKDLGNAKQRLAGVLDQAARTALFRTMLEDVLDALSGTPSLAGIVLVTRDAEAFALAGRYGAECLVEPENRGHTAAVEFAAEVLAKRGAGSAAAGSRRHPSGDPGRRRSGGRGARVRPGQSRLHRRATTTAPMPCCARRRTCFRSGSATTASIRTSPRHGPSESSRRSSSARGSDSTSTPRTTWKRSWAHRPTRERIDCWPEARLSSPLGLNPPTRAVPNRGPRRRRPPRRSAMRLPASSCTRADAK